MGISDQLTCLLRNLYAGQEATVRTRHGIMDWFQIGKGVHQGCILSPWLFNLICRVHHEKCRAGWSTSQNQDCWEKHQQPQICKWYHPMTESEEELKSLLMKAKEVGEKAVLKFNIQKTRIMVSGPITSWQIDGETVETVTDFTFLGSRITADGDGSHEIKRGLLLGRKAMTNLGSIELKWCFWTVVLEKILESPLDCKEIKPVNTKGNQSWIFIGRTHAEAPILWPPDAKSWLTRKDPNAGKNWRQEKGTTEDEMVGWHHQLNDMSLRKLWEVVKNREAWHAVVHGVSKSWTPLRDWTSTTKSRSLGHTEASLRPETWPDSSPEWGRWFFDLKKEIFLQKGILQYRELKRLA